METPVNFDNLRSITGGDAEAEATLLAAFLASARACLDKLSAALSAADETLWRQQAHAFKGLCLNLGAAPLADLCGQAQADWRAHGDDKQAMLRAIEAEFARVHDAVTREMKVVQPTA